MPFQPNIILTFDYEVFLGQDTGTINNCVIKPTNRILEILKQNNAKAIFFVDATWLLFLKENYPFDFQLVTRQIKEIIGTGSSVELHLHPQWLNAIKLNDKIVFTSFENYALHSLTTEEILVLFDKSIKLLEEITLQKIRCFRAGGFCIEPFDKVQCAFEESRIKYDFTVVPGTYLRSGDGYDFDFSNAPSLCFYNFQSNVNIPDPNGQFVEIPVSVYKNNPFFRLLNKIILISENDKIFGDGKSIQESSSNFFRTLFRRLRFSYSLLTIDKMNCLIFRMIVSKYFKNCRLLVIISHPKTLSNKALENLSFVTANYFTYNSLDLDNLLERVKH